MSDFPSSEKKNALCVLKDQSLNFIEELIGSFSGQARGMQMPAVGQWVALSVLDYRLFVNLRRNAGRSWHTFSFLW